MADSSFRFDDSGLKRLGELFKGRAKTVRVGILTGPKMARQKKTDPKSPLTNAEIGAKHEYGDYSATPPIPRRSFLRQPLLSTKTKKRIVADAAEGFERELARGEVANAGKAFYGKIGAGLVAAVQDAFDESGPGWKPLARETIRRRRERKLWPRAGTKALIDLGELRHSISFKIMDAK